MAVTLKMSEKISGFTNYTMMQREEKQCCANLR